MTDQPKSVHGYNLSINVVKRPGEPILGASPRRTGRETAPERARRELYENWKRERELEEAEKAQLVEESAKH